MFQLCNSVCITLHRNVNNALVLCDILYTYCEQPVIMEPTDPGLENEYVQL